MTKEELKRDKYYLKKYGISLARYDYEMRRQSGCCDICKRPQESFTKRFAVDHCHKLVKIKIQAAKGMAGWAAVTKEPVQGKIIGTGGFRYKQEAVREVRKQLKAASVRGLLCPWCNRGLRYYADDPVRLENAAKYLNNHQRKGK